MSWTRRRSNRLTSKLYPGPAGIESCARLSLCVQIWFLFIYYYLGGGGGVGIAVCACKCWCIGGMLCIVFVQMWVVLTGPAARV